MLCVFKIIRKKIKYPPNKEGASSRLRKDNAAGNFGDTISSPNCWTVREALLQSILDNWAVSQELRGAILKRRLDSRARSQVIDVQMQIQSSIFFFGMQLRVLVWGMQTTHPLLYDKHACICPLTKLSKLQKHVFHHYKAWERKPVSVRFLKNLERQNEN